MQHLKKKSFVLNVFCLLYWVINEFENSQNLKSKKYALLERRKLTNNNDQNISKKSGDLSASVTIKSLGLAERVLTVAKFLLSLAIDLALVLAIFYIVFYYLKLFPDYLGIPVGDNLLQILITTNGVLLAFVGVIFAQLLSSTTDQQNVIYQRILEVTDENLRTNLSELVNSLERKRIAIVLSTGTAFVAFTNSILLSLSTIAKDSLLKTTDTFSVYGLFYAPLISTVIGITMVLLALALPGKPPLKKLVVPLLTDKK
jgi:GGDEF domain-containing protein